MASILFYLGKTFIDVVADFALPEGIMKTKFLSKSFGYRKLLRSIGLLAGCHQM